MNINVIDDDFQYRLKVILKKIMKDYKEEIADREVSDWLWENREILGEYFYNEIVEYCGFDDIVEEIEDEAIENDEEDEPPY